MATDGTFNYRRPMRDVARMLAELPGEQKLSLKDLQSGSPEQRMKIMGALQKSGGFFSVEQKTVLSLRDHPLSLQEGGAALVPAPSAVDFQSAEFRSAPEEGARRAFGTDEAVDSHELYYAEVEQIARDVLAPEGEVVHAFCNSHIIRDSAGTGAVGDDAGPIRTVHNDFTEEYGEVTRSRLTDHPSKTAKFYRKMLEERRGLSFSREELEQYRLVVLNTWRPITEAPLRRDPLAVCDNRTIQKSDLMPVRTGIGQNPDDPDDDFALEVFMSTPNPEHRWHYVDAFDNQELLVFKTYDSDMDPFVPTMHSAFELPEQDAEQVRESCEARVVCLLKRTPSSKL